MKRSTPSPLVISALALIFCLACCPCLPAAPFRVRTFSFIAEKPGADLSETKDRKALHGMIQKAITKNLAAPGLSRVGSNGDVTVGDRIWKIKPGHQ